MGVADRWRIPPEASDWECTWAADELFHLRYFLALTLPEKIRAVEQMEQVAAALGDRRRDRRTAKK
ncbi:MAG TPA: hypothetical protein VI078_17975 [bacterium]